MNKTALNGECVLFVRVAPGTVPTAIRELTANPNVTNVETITGPYDLVVTGEWNDLNSLTNFRQWFESQPWCQGCESSVSVNSWTRSRKPANGLPIAGWTLIQTTNPNKTFKNLQKVRGVYRLYATTGGYNVIANYYVNQPTDFLDTVTNTIHGFKEIRRTETYVSFPSSNGSSPHAGWTKTVGNKGTHRSH